jgi:outer membrane protein OmpA-like peptidoglycan-associated protein
MGSNRRLPVLLGTAAVLALTGAGVFLWNMNNRIRGLETHLSATERRATSAEQDARQKARQLKALNDNLAATEARAAKAEQSTEQLAAANRDVESQLDRARHESDANAAAAQQESLEKQQALASRQQALSELDRLRQRRAEELARMQQALNRIAPTQRTPTGMVMQLANDSFKFDFDSAALRPENREILSRIAGVLLASEGYRLFIDGYTDDVGTDAYNDGLSKRRGESVRDYLVKAGIPADIIAVNGFGKSNPLVNARTRDARQKNRRVEIGIVDTIISYQTAATGKQRH